MSKQAELHAYIARARRTLQLQAGLRGVVVLLAVVAVSTVLLVVWLNHSAFPPGGVARARLLLVTVSAAAASFGTVWPLLRLSRQRTVQRVEAAAPELKGSLTTFQERDRQGDDPFLELLAADTLRQTAHTPPTSFAPPALLVGMSVAGLLCLLALLWMIFAAPGYLGYGASLLWRGPKTASQPLYALRVLPGDVAVRRNADQPITAELTNLQPDTVELVARYAGSDRGWERTAMRRSGDGKYGFAFAGLLTDVEYYVAAGPLLSPHFRVRVVDLPSVRSLKVTYHYPAWTGLKPEAAEHAGDLRAIEGTQAELQVEMDRPLKGGTLLLDDGRSIQLKGGAGNRYTGTLPMTKDGAYHVASSDAGQPVRLSEDYFIATDKAEMPQVALDKPGADYHASPIEEVTLHMRGSAQFGLRGMQLHYSINGGNDGQVTVPAQPGARSADGSYTLRLEEFKLQPGDVVSVYGTARDGHAESKTDISFIQAEPYDREYSQSQQSGGGGGGGGANGGDAMEISRREKELIGETWKALNGKTPEQAGRGQGSFLSDAQTKLRDQVTALSTRMNRRDLSSATEELSGFEKDMRDAANDMQPAARQLGALQWHDALQSEQKALQALLRAEATFRQMQVAFGQQGGGGGGSSTSRDLASLFDLELDKEKNQYETAKTSSPEEQKKKEVDDALSKLDALAKRQEELAREPKHPQEAMQQRWQQEMLRREAEQLQREMEQLAQKGQGGQAGKQGQSSAKSASQGSQSEASQSGKPGSQTGQDGAQSNGASAQSGGRMEQALSRIRSAEDAMKRSGSAGTQAESQQAAAQRLREAAGLMGGAQRSMTSDKLADMAREADRLHLEEHAQAGRIDQFTRDTRNQQLDAESYRARVQQRNQMSADRQGLSQELSRLERTMRGAAQGTAGKESAASQALRDALTEMDRNNLQNRVQRTADMLRSGMNPSAGGMEQGVADGLSKLSQQLHTAEGSLGKGGAPGSAGKAQGDSTQTAALGRVERLRSELQAMSRLTGSQPGSGQQQARSGGQTPQPGAGSGGQTPQPGAGSGGQAQGQGQQRGQGGSAGQGGQAGEGGQGWQPGGGQRSAGRSSQAPGQGATPGASPGGAPAEGSLSAQGSSPASSPGQAAEADRELQRSLRELQALRGLVQGDPEAAKDLNDIAAKLQGVGRARAEGKSAVVTQLQADILHAVDRLELQLQRSGMGDAHTGRPYAIPAGYNDSVADYYRRLSKGGK